MRKPDLKKYFIGFAFLFLPVLVFAQQKKQDQFTMKGTFLNGEEEEWVYLSYTNSAGKYIRDSAKVKKRTFQFMGFVTEPTRASFTGKAQVRSMDDPNYTLIYLEPGIMKVKVRKNAFKKATITGSKTQNEYNILQTKMMEIQKRWKVVLDTLHAVNKRSNFEYQELKNWVLVPYFAEINEINRTFLIDHPTSYVSPSALRSLARELTTDSLKMYYDRFPEELKNTVFGKSIQQEIERRQIGIPGTMASNFSTKDINGENLSLTDYKGKYVLLDFWASWCLPCRKGNPHLLMLYAEYKDKGFEIIGVASDDGKEEAWRKAVVQDKIGVWKHVLSGYDQEKRLRGEINEKHIGLKYGIAALPTKILIDPNGLIIGRYGESQKDVNALDKKLLEIFSN